MSDTPTTPEVRKPWYKQMNRYHWFVFVVCSLGWGFDTLDQQLFALARTSAISDLMGGLAPDDPDVIQNVGNATSLMLLGWGIGGIIFGIMSDKFGRARTMIFTILMYSVFTGLCGLSQGTMDFLLYRFLTGMGVGGQFAASASLLAETMPDDARPRTLGLLQIVAAIGNMGAAVINIFIVSMISAGSDFAAWRVLFLIGLLPALLAVVVMFKLEEPERWKEAKEAGKKTGSLSELFGIPRWRKNVILGMILASTGIIGLWGIGFFSVDLTQMSLRSDGRQTAIDAGENAVDGQLVRALIASPEDIAIAREAKIKPSDLIGKDLQDEDLKSIYTAMLAMTEEEGADTSKVTSESLMGWLDAPDEESGLKPQTTEERDRRLAILEAEEKGDTPEIAAMITTISDRTAAISKEADKWKSIASFLFNFGAVIGTYAFAILAVRIGRRPTFTIFFCLALFATILVFMTMNTRTEVIIMQPMLGFCVLSLFGGYAIYFPELFPTHLRATAVSFCYNIARFIAVAAPMLLGMLTAHVFKDFSDPFRVAGASMSLIFVLGIIVTWMGPETKDQPLPE